jgi:hypothetical protein
MPPALLLFASVGDKHFIERINTLPLKRRQRYALAPLPGQYLRISQRAHTHAALALAVHIEEIAPHMRQLVRHRGNVEPRRRLAGLLLHSFKMPLERLAVLLPGAELERSLGKLEQLAL